ncbi:GDSL esterase/lipase At5g33370-like [Oryza brachyantha]|uniref:GDSL esterase/lipase At5g33370-like n=1 Tax=Oryza brachyantha TaxID=4533 RepID=UPI001ADB06DA|nr:GDSL esterase/lipase At5g33370-like [Oryza brachyantha]
MGGIAAVVVAVVVAATVLVCEAKQQAARALFVFGDSLVDSGNNNYLLTTARADSPPYGLDYPTHRATGRFSNGLNVPDIISEYLGADSVLPYLSPHLDGAKLLHGANFASAGVGILNDTGIQFANIIRIEKQLRYFQQYQDRVRWLIGGAAARRLVEGALVLITLGGNDFVNNYYLVPFSARSREFALPDYVRYIIAEYSKVLRQLYDMGARRVLVTGSGPLGCAPAELATRSATGECDAELQRAAALYNPQLVRMTRELNEQLGADVFVAVNAYRMHMDFISDPAAYGFATSKVACCGQGPYNGVGLCTAMSSICPDRSLYVFWDNFHPTERANRIIVSQFMSGSPDYMHPFNLSTILAMDAAAAP